jgi:hypothetical protein
MAGARYRFGANAAAPAGRRRHYLLERISGAARCGRRRRARAASYEVKVCATARSQHYRLKETHGRVRSEGSAEKGCRLPSRSESTRARGAGRVVSSPRRVRRDPPAPRLLFFAILVRGVKQNHEKLFCTHNRRSLSTHLFRRSRRSGPPNFQRHRERLLTAVGTSRRSRD